MQISKREQNKLFWQTTYSKSKKMVQYVVEVAIFIEFELRDNSEVSRCKGYVHNQLLCTTYNNRIPMKHLLCILPQQCVTT